MSSHDHVPVLLEETMAYLSPRENGLYIDATLGYAGHARRILEMTSPAGRLLGVDADRLAFDSARASLQAFAGRVSLVCSYFDRLDEIAREWGFVPVDGILFDLGVSSPQLDDPGRGFSFQASGPLDMRMGPDAGHTAADIVAGASEEELARIFHELGEERYSRRIARQIVAARARSPVTTTNELARVVAAAMPRHPAAGARVARQQIHPATRVFQALRIAVNDELGRLREALPRALSILRSQGRLVVITFHSLEDRIVKRFMQAEARGCICPPDIPRCACGREPRLRILTKKPLTPSIEEVKANPRSRSAKLRAAEAI
jgi:16S rRNA (cytosine1402-N4)-methyltransferase